MPREATKPETAIPPRRVAAIPAYRGFISVPKGIMLMLPPWRRESVWLAHEPFQWQGRGALGNIQEKPWYSLILPSERIEGKIDDKLRMC
jgi:hypothetical protein